MKRFHFFAMLVVLTQLAVLPLVYGGTYHIGKDESGYYIQTDGDGRWALGPGNQDGILDPGQGGTYQMVTDGSALYLRTDNHGEFEIDQAAYDQAQAELEQSRQTLGNTPTRVVIDGNKVLVPVVLTYRGDQVRAMLLLDTGASITVVNRSVAKKLKITKTTRSELMVVGGDKIQTDLVAMDTISVGPVQKKDLTVGIIDHGGASVPWEGLLGMDFLRQIDYRIDFKNQRIEWNP